MRTRGPRVFIQQRRGGDGTEGLNRLRIIVVPSWWRRFMPATEGTMLQMFFNAPWAIRRLSARRCVHERASETSALTEAS
jgi:hypothetical protein